MARRAARPTSFEKRGQLTKGESDPNRVANQPDALDGISRKQSIPPGRPGGLLQQAHSFVEPDRIGAHAGAAGKLADSEDLA
jgi:hypothetical protein